MEKAPLAGVLNSSEVEGFGRRKIEQAQACAASSLHSLTGNAGIPASP
ncbi:hypothetical protein [Sphingobium sp. CFD-2]|nr:hypothetical protein [Sphingobium sp. CFD-2]